MEPQFDVIVIGGGVNGTGVARDAALRGLRVLLLEKRDFASGASGANSGMIHGGIRYLLSEVETTRLSCLDSGYIQRIAPHLIFRIPLMMAIPKDHKSPTLKKAYLEGIEAFFSLYDKFQPLKRGKPHVRLTPQEVPRVEPLLGVETYGAVITDEWGINPFRLCIANAVDAAEHGAVMRNYTEADGLLRGPGGKITGVRAFDTLTGQRHEFTARAVFNATGPWLPGVARLGGAGFKLRPGKGIHLVFDRRICATGIIVSAIDGRQVFVIPHENGSIAGTTDDDYYGDLDNLNATRDEVEYLLQALEFQIPTIRNYRISRVFCGVRPTLYGKGQYEDELSRGHRIVHHKDAGALGFFSLGGGKLAAFRIIAEEATDILQAYLGGHGRSTTHEKPLPGGDRPADIPALAAQYGVEPWAVERLAYRHGSRAAQVLAIIEDDPTAREVVCACEPVLAAEVRYVCRHEFVRRAQDIRRRTRCGMGGCQGTFCVQRAAQIFAEEAGATPGEAHAEVADFLKERMRGKRPVLSGPSLAQEELNQAIYKGLFRMDDFCDPAQGASPISGSPGAS